MKVVNCESRHRVPDSRYSGHPNHLIRSQGQSLSRTKIHRSVVHLYSHQNRQGEEEKGELTDSPIPIWRHASIIALILERPFKYVYVPAMPGKELPGKMYLKKCTFSAR